MTSVCHLFGIILCYSRNVEKSLTPCSTPSPEDTRVTSFEKILAKTQKDALEAKAMIEEVKKMTKNENQNNNKQTKGMKAIKAVSKLGKYNRKAKSHGGITAPKPEVTRPKKV